MKNWTGSVLGLAILGGCQAKLDVSKDVAENADQAVVEGAVRDQKAPLPGELGKQETLMGQWSSTCVVNPANSLVSASVGVYEFSESGVGRFRAYSYRDSLCEQRYTKSDVDKIKAKLRENAASLGAPVSEEEFSKYDVLWLPPITQLKYAVGKKHINGLTELDLEISPASGQVRNLYLSFFIDKGDLYFAKTCTQGDAQLGNCGPAAGDTVETRGKAIDFDIGYTYKALSRVPE